MIELYRAAHALARGDVLERRDATPGGPSSLPRRTTTSAGQRQPGCWGSPTGRAVTSRPGIGLRRMHGRACTRAGYVADTFGCAIALADIRIAQGRLGDALRTYQQALRRAAEQGGPVLRGTADMYVGMSEILRERDDLPAATEHLLTQPGARRAHRAAAEPVSLAGRDGADPAGAGRPRSARSTCSTRRSACTSATSSPMCGRSRRCGRGSGSRRAQLAEALGWVREQGLSADDDLSYLREFEHITLARVLLASHRATDAKSLDQAAALLDRLLAAAEAGGATGSVIEILVLQALAQQAAGATCRPRWRPATCADFGRAGGLRADLRRRGSTDGRPAASGRERRDRPGYVRRLLAADAPTEDRRWPGASRRPDRAVERARNRRAAAARHRPGRPGYRPPAHRVAEHRANAHQEHLRQAGGEQPPGGRPAGQGARPDVADRGPATPAL